MKSMRPLLSILFLTGVLGLSEFPAGAQDVLFKVQVSGTNYCHMKFPAIREDSLAWDRPVLQDKSSRDVIDFYGPCNHDPRGKAEIALQRAERSRQDVQDNN